MIKYIPTAEIKCTHENLIAQVINKVMNEIQQHGVLHPIVIMDNPESDRTDYRYLAIDGNYKLRACQLLKHCEVPTVCVSQTFAESRRPIIREGEVWRFFSILTHCLKGVELESDTLLKIQEALLKEARR